LALISPTWLPKSSNECHDEVLGGLALQRLNALLRLSSFSVEDG